MPKPVSGSLNEVCNDLALRERLRDVRHVYFGYLWIRECRIPWAATIENDAGQFLNLTGNNFCECNPVPWRIPILRDQLATRRTANIADSHRFIRVGRKMRLAKASRHVDGLLKLVVGQEIVNLEIGLMNHDVKIGLDRSSSGSTKTLWIEPNFFGSRLRHMGPRTSQAPTPNSIQEQ